MTVFWGGLWILNSSDSSSKPLFPWSGQWNFISFRTVEKAALPQNGIVSPLLLFLSGLFWAKSIPISLTHYFSQDWKLNIFTQQTGISCDFSRAQKICSWEQNVLRNIVLKLFVSNTIFLASQYHLAKKVKIDVIKQFIFSELK